MKHKLLLLEIKQYCRQLPRTILMSLILIGLSFLVCFSASKLLYAKEPLLMAKVGIVTDDPENVYLDFILQIMQSNENVKEHIEFVFLSPTEAGEALLAGEIIAVLEFPQDAVEGILNGTNSPIVVRFGNQNDVTAVILGEITNILGSLLSSAQAGTYTASDVFVARDARALLPEAFRQIDSINFSYVLDREDLFTSSPVSFEGTSSILLYYIASMVLLLLLLCGVGNLNILHFDENTFAEVLRIRGITTGRYYAVRFLSYTLYLFACLLVLYLGAIPFTGLLSARIPEIMPLEFTFAVIPVLFLLSIFLCAYTQFLSAISPTPAMCLLFFFLLSIGMMICSGGFLPLAFLPEKLRRLAPLLPTYELHQILIGLLSGQNPGRWFAFASEVNLSGSLLMNPVPGILVLLIDSLLLYFGGLGALKLRLKNS